VEQDEMTSQEMMKAQCPKGFIFTNIAEVDEQQNWVLQEKPKRWDEEGNPNHRMYENQLFGYGQKEFMAKQYK
jgi:hypothetical protein